MSLHKTRHFASLAKGESANPSRSRSRVDSATGPGRPGTFAGGRRARSRTDTGTSANRQRTSLAPRLFCQGRIGTGRHSASFASLALGKSASRFRRTAVRLGLALAFSARRAPVAGRLNLIAIPRRQNRAHGVLPDAPGRLVPGRSRCSVANDVRLNERSKFANHDIVFSF